MAIRDFGCSNTPDAPAAGEQLAADQLERDIAAGTLPGPTEDEREAASLQDERDEDDRRERRALAVEAEADEAEFQAYVTAWDADKGHPGPEEAVRAQAAQAAHELKFGPARDEDEDREDEDDGGYPAGYL